MSGDLTRLEPHSHIVYIFIHDPAKQMFSNGDSH